jgi:hypothetical protein
MIYFLTYGDNKYDKSKKRITEEATNFKLFDHIIIKSPEDLPKNLPNEINNILKLSRGGGYWIWKPIIIKEIIDKMDDNDVLIYVDAGCHLNTNGIERLKEYINIISDKELNKPFIRFELPVAEKVYTNSTIFKSFGVLNNSDIVDTNQLVGGIQIIRKCDISNKIIKLWYNTAIEKPLLFTDHYNNIDKLPDFYDNRHDQSIFSVISKIFKKYMNILADETFPYNDKYPIFAGRIRG